MSNEKRECKGMLLKNSKSSLFNTYHISINDKGNNWLLIDEMGENLSFKITNELTGDKSIDHFYLEFPVSGEFAKNLFKVFKRISKNCKAQQTNKGK